MTLKYVERLLQPMSEKRFRQEMYILLKQGEARPVPAPTPTAPGREPARRAPLPIRRQPAEGAFEAVQGLAPAQAGVAPRARERDPDRGRAAEVPRRQPARPAQEEAHRRIEQVSARTILPATRVPRQQTPGVPELAPGKTGWSVEQVAARTAVTPSGTPLAQVPAQLDTPQPASTRPTTPATPRQDAPRARVTQPDAPQDQGRARATPAPYEDQPVRAVRVPVVPPAARQPDLPEEPRPYTSAPIDFLNPDVDDLPLSPILPPTAGGGPGLAIGKVQSGKGGVVKVALYPDGPDGEEGDTVSVTIQGLDPDETIPADSWLYNIYQFSDEDGNDTYFCQPPLWIG